MQKNNSGIFFNEKLSECEKAYVLGLVITDGCIRRASKNSKSICISSKDKYMVEMIKEFACPNRKLYQDGDNWQVVWTNENDVKYLANLDIAERKTYTVRLPDIKCMSHLIRGIFDGDGCVYKSITHDNKYGRLYEYTYVSITSASIKFLEDVKRYLEGVDIQSRINRDKRHFCTYNLLITRMSSVEKFFDHIYEGCGKWKLERKFEKFHT